MQVVVHLVGRFTDLVEIKDRREGWNNFAVIDRLIGVPRFAVVRKVRSLNRLELHPEVAVVVLNHVTRGRGAGHDGAATLGDKDTGPHC